ncbi:hypothetical protein Q9189_002385 [Teloschistes chrysophthalmus]
MYEDWDSDTIARKAANIPAGDISRARTENGDYSTDPIRLIDSVGLRGRRASDPHPPLGLRMDPRHNTLNPPTFPTPPVPAIPLKASAPSSPTPSSINNDTDLDVAPKRRRTSGTTSRGVANLTPEQLAKKRANDREAQRAIRERTKTQIETLERKIHDLSNQQPHQELQLALRQKQYIEAENVHIKKTLNAALALLQPLLRGGLGGEVLGQSQNRYHGTQTYHADVTPLCRRRTTGYILHIVAELEVPSRHINPPQPARSISPFTIRGYSYHSQQDIGISNLWSFIARDKSPFARRPHLVQPTRAALSSQNGFHGPAAERFPDPQHESQQPHW